MAHLDKLNMTLITAREACKLPSLTCIRQVEEKAVRNTSRCIGLSACLTTLGFPGLLDVNGGWKTGSQQNSVDEMVLSQNGLKAWSLAAKPQPVAPSRHSSLIHVCRDVEDMYPGRVASRFLYSSYPLIIYCLESFV
jgi:hypothetical protein